MILGVLSVLDRLKMLVLFQQGGYLKMVFWQKLFTPFERSAEVAAVHFLVLEQSE